MKHLAFLSAVFLLIGCEDGARTDNRTLDVDDPEFRQGQAYHQQGETRKALECFLKVIDARKGSAESHLEAGRMYLELQDPLPAIYHFNQYIRLKPTSQQTTLVRQMVRTAEKQFMQQLPGRPFDLGAPGGGALDGRLQALQRENESLKLALADANRNPRRLVPPTKTGGPSPAEVTPPVRPNAENAPAARSHVIARGDSLSSIARRYYDDASPARISALFNANRDKMTSPNNLPQIGTVIVLPE